MKAVGSASTQVWLRGNVRPAMGMAAVVGVLVAGLLACAAVAELPVWQRSLVAFVCGIALVAVGGLAATAALPRLVRADEFLRVRLSPLQVCDVPLTVIECFFLGSSLIEPGGTGAGGQLPSDVATRRVGTLVMRVAERSAEWHARPTSPAWGSWQDGAIVFDGRWCEPLSVALVTRLSTQLMEAKRVANAMTAVPMETHA